MTTEREVKLGVWPGFSMPDLVGVAEGATVESLPSLRLEAIYHDTASLALARAGITLRYRTGDDGGDVWTLKLPKSAGDAVLVRDELDVVGSPKVVPAPLRDQIVAWTRTARLTPVAKLQTARHRTVVRDGDGKQLAEVVDDEVSVLDGRHVALRFREVEVELSPEADEAVLEEIVVRLRAAGAGAPDPTPKVMRALGPRALTPPDFVVPTLPKDASTGDVVRVGIAKAVDRILRNDAGVRVGEHSEPVHQARVGTRRLRSDLRTFAPVLDETWASALGDELAWLGGLLGAARDADVLLERVRGEITSAAPDDDGPGDEIVAVLAAQRDRARASLLRGMRTRRYVELLDRLVEAAVDPRVLPGAARPATEVVPALVSGPWRKLRKEVARAGSHPADQTLHAIRKRAKRARYAADVGALVVGKPAERFAKAIAGVQEVLGEHQDACVERAWLHENVGALSPRAALLAGRLVARADDVAERGRDDWRRAWERADEGTLRAWLNR